MFFFDGSVEPVLFFDVVSMKVSEDIGDMQLPVKRTGDLTDAVSVVCYTESGSATGSTPPYLLTGYCVIVVMVNRFRWLSYNL